MSRVANIRSDTKTHPLKMKGSPSQVGTAVGEANSSECRTVSRYYTEPGEVQSTIHRVAIFKLKKKRKTKFKLKKKRKKKVLK